MSQKVPPCFEPGAQGVFTAAALDTETTGLSSETDQVIEIGISLFRFELPSGRVLDAPDHPRQSYSALQDPGFVLSLEIQKVTGITPDMLVGQRIDWDRVDQVLSEADLLIAHNAQFDRGFVDRKSRVSPSKVWACTAWQVEWRAKGFKNARLQDLCGALGIVYQAHRAMSDVEAMLELIGREDAFTGKPYLLEMLGGAGSEVVYVWVEGRTYDQRDLLKAFGFRWNPTAKVWGKIILAADVAKETESVLAGVKDALVRSRPVALCDRFKAV